MIFKVYIVKVLKHGSTYSLAMRTEKHIEFKKVCHKHNNETSKYDILKYFREIELR